MALRNMLVRVGADVSQLKKGMREAQNSVAYFGRSVSDSMKGIKGSITNALAVGGTGFLFVQGAKDAMQYEALMSTLGESMGDSRKEFEKWQESVGNAFGFSKLQGAELANMLSLNFKSIATSTEDLVKKTTDMMELGAIISSKRGMAMAEVSDRIRSAMNQEADGAMELGVDVRIAAIKAGQAYQEMANGEPWDKLSENMRKTILYHHIFEQVSKNLGMTMQDTTAMRMASFTATLADLRMALGQAFLPILYTVLPILNRMAQALLRVVQVVGAFMRSLFGAGFKTQAQTTSKAVAGGIAPIQGQADAVKDLGKAQEKTGKATKKASKEAKRGIASFDEINQLQDPAGAGAGAGGAGAGGGGGGGGAGGLGDLGGMPEVKPPFDFKAFEESIDEMAQKFKKFTEPIRKLAIQVWTAISTFAIEKFKQIGAWWAENGAQITQGFKNAWNLIFPVIAFVVKFVWESIKGLISGVITFFQGLVEFFTGIFTGDWKMVWEGLKKIFIGAFQAIWNFTNLTFIGGLKKIFLSLAKDGIKIFLNLGKNIKNMFSQTAKDAIKSFTGFLKSMKTFFKDHGTWLYNEGVRIAHRVISAFDKIGAVGKTIVQAIKDAFSGLVNWFTRVIITPIANNLENIKEGFSKGIKTGIKTVMNSAIGGFNTILSGFNAIKNKSPLKNAIPNLRIPTLAQGGIVSRATLAMVGEGSQTEAVAPLDKLQGFISNAVLNAMGDNRGATGDIILNIDGRTFARIINPHLANESQRIGKNVRLKPI
jgi:hypothetical protein